MKSMQLSRSIGMLIAVWIAVFQLSEETVQARFGDISGGAESPFSQSLTSHQEHHGISGSIALLFEEEKC